MLVLLALPNMSAAPAYFDPNYFSVLLGESDLSPACMFDDTLASELAAYSFWCPYLPRPKLQKSRIPESEECTKKYMLHSPETLE